MRLCFLKGSPVHQTINTLEELCWNKPTSYLFAHAVLTRAHHLSMLVCLQSVSVTAPSLSCSQYTGLHGQYAEKMPYSSNHNVLLKTTFHLPVEERPITRCDRIVSLNGNYGSQWPMWSMWEHMILPESVFSIFRVIRRLWVRKWRSEEWASFFHHSARHSHRKGDRNTGNEQLAV